MGVWSIPSEHDEVVPALAGCVDNVEYTVNSYTISPEKYLSGAVIHEIGIKFLLLHDNARDKWILGASRGTITAIYVPGGEIEDTHDFDYTLDDVTSRTESSFMEDVVRDIIRQALRPQAPSGPFSLERDVLDNLVEEMEHIAWDGEQAEVVAFPAGTTGLGEAISRRDSMYEEPEEFIRAYRDKTYPSSTDEN